MNDEKDIELDEELDTENEELDDAPEQHTEVEEGDDDVTDVFDEDDTDEETTEDDFEYDEDGNIVLKETDEDEPEEDSAPEKAEETEDTAENTTDEKDSEIASLKQKMGEREDLFRKALKAVGIENTNIDEAIAQLAADAEGTTASEWLKAISEEKKKSAAEELYKKVLFDQMVNADLSVLHAKYPETINMTKFEDIPNYKRFGELRDLGLSAEEAYAAANPSATRAAVAASVKKQSLNETKAHLHSNVPKAAKNNSVYISKAEMEECRELFPEMSDKDIIALYKKTK